MESAFVTLLLLLTWPSVTLSVPVDHFLLPGKVPTPLGSLRPHYARHPELCETVYDYNPALLNWYTANRFCQSLHGHLAVVTTKLESEYLWERFGRQRKGIWLGASDRAREGHWTWVNNRVMFFTNWYRGQPNNIPRDSNCLEMRRDGTWDDIDCSRRRPSVCEYKVCAYPMIDANGTSGRYDLKVFEATPDFTPLHDLLYFAKLPNVDFNFTSFIENSSDNATNTVVHLDDIPSVDTKGKDLNFAVVQVSSSPPVSSEDVEVTSGDESTWNGLPDNVDEETTVIHDATIAPEVEPESETEPEDYVVVDAPDEDELDRSSPDNYVPLGTSSILNVLLRLLDQSQRSQRPCTAFPHTNGEWVCNRPELPWLCILNCHGRRIDGDGFASSLGIHVGEGVIVCDDGVWSRTDYFCS